MTEEELRKSQPAPAQAPYAAPQPQYQQAAPTQAPYAAPTQAAPAQAPYAAPTQAAPAQAPYAAPTQAAPAQAPYAAPQPQYQQAAPTPVQPAYGYRAPQQPTYNSTYAATGRKNYAKSIISMALGIFALNFGIAVFIMAIVLLAFVGEYGDDLRYIYTLSSYFSNANLPAVYGMTITFTIFTMAAAITAICLCSSYRKQYPNNRMCNAGKGLSIASLVLSGFALISIIVFGICLTL